MKERRTIAPLRMMNEKQTIRNRTIIKGSNVEWPAKFVWEYQKFQQKNVGEVRVLLD